MFRGWFICDYICFACLRLSLSLALMRIICNSFRPRGGGRGKDLRNIITMKKFEGENNKKSIWERKQLNWNKNIFVSSCLVARQLFVYLNCPRLHPIIFNKIKLPAEVAGAFWHLANEIIHFPAAASCRYITFDKAKFKYWFESSRCRLAGPVMARRKKTARGREEGERVIE